MKEIILDKNSLRASYSKGKVLIKDKNNKIIEEINLERVDSILVYGSSQLTTQLIKKASSKGINIHYFTNNGLYQSSVVSEFNSNFERQVKQFEASRDEEFCLEIGKKIITSKIEEQIQLLKAYDKDCLLDKDTFTPLERMIDKTKKADKLNQVLGYEGRSARSYFYHLGLLVDYRFKFNRRTRKPPKDPFNSLISYAYSYLYRYMIGVLIRNGLNVGISSVHKNKRKHATLASDLMEEWRAIIADECAMRVIQQGLVTIDMFDKTDKGIRMSKECRRIFVNELNNRMNESHFYYRTYPKKYNFENAVNIQVQSYIRAVENKDPSYYLSVRD